MSYGSIFNIVNSMDAYKFTATRRYKFDKAQYPRPYAYQRKVRCNAARDVEHSAKLNKSG